MNTALIYPFSTGDGERNEDYVVEVKSSDSSTEKKVIWLKHVRGNITQRTQIILDPSASCASCAYTDLDGPVIDGFDFGVFICSKHEQPINKDEDLDDIVCPQWSMCPIDMVFARGMSNGEI